MAQSSNTLDRYDIANSVREDFMNTIYNIAPTEVPFTSNVGRGSSDQTYTEWQIDTLATANTDNTHIDGDEFAAAALVPPTRVGNYHTISRKDIVISRRANIVRKAGRKSETAYEIAKGAKELKRDVEAMATLRRAARAGSSTQSMQTAGVAAWIRTNSQRGTSGTAPTLSGSGGNGYPNAVGTDGTDRGLKETHILNAIRQCYDAGGNPDTIMVSTQLKQGVSNYMFTSSARIATQNQDHMSKPKGGATVLGAVDMYVSDFGVLSIVPNRFMPTDEVYVLDTEYWELRYLDSYHTEVIAKVGDHERRMMIVDWTVCSKNEAASAVVADITEDTAVSA